MNHSLQCWSEAFFYLPKFLLLSLVFAYVYISQGSIETLLPCGEIYKTTLLQIV